MKKFKNISYIIILIGLIFIFRYYPGAALLLVIGTLLHLTYSIVFLIKNVKEDLKKSFENVSISLWTVYIVFRILYLPGGPFILGV